MSLRTSLRTSPRGGHRAATKIRLGHHTFARAPEEKRSASPHFTAHRSPACRPRYRGPRATQFITLRLQTPAIVKRIKFGKYTKVHVCNLKEFKIYGGLKVPAVLCCPPGRIRLACCPLPPPLSRHVPRCWCLLQPEGMLELLHSGLRNDSEAEVFDLVHVTEGVEFPVEYIKVRTGLRRRRVPALDPP